MKPNDKAIEAAFAAAEAHIGNTSQREWLREILTAAYAAQFQSEDYAELVKELRERAGSYDSHDYHEENELKAADAIEALLAERDALKSELASGNMWIQARATVFEELAMVRAERDALAARLAPVDDEALVEIATREIFIERRSLAAAIAAIRPHIEAAEREMCAKIADKYEGEWHSDTADACARAIAAAIRSGK